MSESGFPVVVELPASAAAIAEATKDMVNNPAHYGGKDNPYECIKVIEAWGFDKNFNMGTMLRYVCRHGKKDDVVQDLEKARWYLDREIAKLKVART